MNYPSQKIPNGGGTLVMRYAGRCPICDNRIEEGTVITCRRCWPLVPAQERVAVGNMYRARQPIEAKMMKIVRLVREKHPELTPVVLGKTGTLQPASA